MISLKKYLDMDEGTERRAGSDLAALLCAGLESYRTTLIAAGEAGSLACPPVGADLPYVFGKLADSLGREPTQELLIETGIQASNKLSSWADQSVEYFNARTTEVRDLLLVVARTAASVGKRDEQYVEHFNQFRARLCSISTLEDLTHVRASLVQQAVELKRYVDQMNEESQKLVASLQSEVKTYETKLKKVEEQALYDFLTGLPNRRYLSDRIDARISLGQPFSVVMIDVNRLKQVNDTYGHLAGDNLLRQFAQELRSSLRGTDIVGRWGGDEFLLIVDGDIVGVQSQIARLQKWVFGRYTIRPGKGSAEVKIDADAAIGVAEWERGQSLAELIERADTEMYKHKQQMRAGEFTSA